jgi:diguanylate cyclase (GGDEF)-like protein/PAS domain S-box-containing protein
MSPCGEIEATHMKHKPTQTPRQDQEMSLLHLPAAKPAVAIVILYAVLVGGLLGLHHLWIRTLEGVRADIAGELRTADTLVRYASTRDSAHYPEYLGLLAARLRDGRARAELESPTPDFALVYRALHDARPRPARFAGVATLFRRLGVVGGFDRLITVWTEANGHLTRLGTVAVGLHREMSPAGGSEARLDRALTEMPRLVAQLRASEREYVEALAEVAGAVRHLLEQVALAMTALGFAGSLILWFVGATRLRRALSSLRTRVIEVTHGNFSQRLETDSTVELGPLASAFNQMTASLVLSKRKAERNSLGKALWELENIMETIPDVICIVDLLGRLHHWNRNLEVVTGLSARDLKERPVVELFGEENRSSIEEAIREGFARGRFEVEGALRGAHGAPASYHWTGAVLEDDRGTRIGLTVSGRDITERKALEAQLAHQAFHDPLTGLPNRALFMDRLTHALARTGRRDSPVAVLFLDLDRFKVINDSLGHGVADRLLVEVGRRLQTCLRPEDTVARLGGDEFAILLEDVDESAAARVAERIASQLQSPFALDGREVFVTTSVGIALSRAGQSGPDEIIRDADLAMYQAKTKGKARYEVFDGRMNGLALQRLDLEIDLRSAVTRQEFKVYYQPIMTVETGCVAEVEALVRWEHPRRGLLPPAEFIALTEETGLIVPIGQWVLTEACRQARQWQQRHPSTPPLVMSVNLSARQFQQPDLVHEIGEALRQSGLDPGSLKLEITETVVMHDAASTLAKLQALKELGIRIAIDDFGTGYSSLSYLRRFPVDTLKIDRSFVSGVGADTEDLAIVRAVVQVARSLNLSVTAEGIETAKQLAQLHSLGCDRGQGDYFAKPLPAEAMDAFLASASRETPIDRQPSGRSRRGAGDTPPRLVA